MTEFHVDFTGGTTKVFDDFGQALQLAAAISAGTGNVCNVDVIHHSESDADDWGGETSTESYLADPEASVSERIIIRAVSIGRVA